MSSIHKRITLYVIFVSILLFVLYIINTENSYAASYKVMFKSWSLYPTDTLDQKLQDSKNHVIKASKVKWKSKKPSIAKINKKGKITAIKVGKTTMIAKYKGKTYKFNIRVVNPYKGGKAPIKFTVMSVGAEYEWYNDGYITLNWDGVPYVSLLNTKYEVYCSTNGGAYKRIKTTKNYYYNYYDFRRGNKYSFKVREILGKYHSKFTHVKSVDLRNSKEPTIDPALEPTSTILKITPSEDYYNHYTLGINLHFAFKYLEKYDSLYNSFKDSLDDVGKPFELYVSKDGGDYNIVSGSLLRYMGSSITVGKPNYDAYYDYDYVEAGSTYTFKVRPILGDKYGDFSNLKNVYIKKVIHNTKIRVEPSNISLKVGETKTVKLTGDKSGVFHWYYLSDGASYIVKLPINNNFALADTVETDELSITGLKEGTAQIGICDPLDKSISDILTVTVEQ